MNRRVSWMLAALVGAGIGTGVFVWLVSSVAFAGMVALSWTLGVGFGFRHDLVFGRFETLGRGPSLWSGAFTGFLTLVAFVGTMSLPVSTQLSFAASLLVFGVGFASLQFGAGMARARHDETTSTDGSERTTS